MHKSADKCLAAAVAAAFFTAGGVAAAPLTTADLDALEFKTVNGGVATPGRGGLLPAARKGAVWIDGALSVAEEERPKGESGK